jgi:rRNA maturation endonuclease Nob1
MKSYLINIIAILLLVFAGVLSSCESKESKKEAGVYYTCPMHPDIKKDEPGQCPICGMDLVRKTDDVNHSDSSHKH